jgi:excisionase family DNA binding protein
MERLRDIFTPEQAAAYLQVNRETIYRFIRDGRLVASRLGRSYRIPRQSVEWLLWSTRTRDDIVLRDYTDTELDEFLAADRLSPEQEAIARRAEQTALPNAETRGR